MDSIIITFNSGVTETASEAFGKHRQKNKPWVTADILDLCDKRRDLRKKSIKECMKKANRDWIGEQLKEIEENLGRATARGHTNL